MPAFATALLGFVDELAGALDTLGSGKLRRPAFVIVQEGARYRCYRTDRHKPDLTAEGAVEELGGAIFPPEAKTHPLELRIDGSSVVTKILQLPEPSRGYVDAIIRNQLERITPWAAERAAFDYVISDENGAGSNQFTVRVVAAARDRIDTLVREFAAAGVTIGRVGVSGDRLDAPSPIDFLHEGRRPRRERLRHVVAGTLFALVALAIGTASYAGVRIWQLNAESAALQTAIYTARESVRALPASSQGSEPTGLLAQKQLLQPMVLVIETLSAIIPPNTYLTEVAVEERVLTIAGYSRDAPALIEILENSDLLSDVRFAAATTRDDVSRRDRFEIQAQLAPAKRSVP